MAADRPSLLMDHEGASTSTNNAVTDRRRRHDTVQHRSAYSPHQTALSASKAPLRLTQVTAISCPIRVAYLVTSLIICAVIAGHAQVLDTSGVSGGAATYVPIDSWVYPALDRLAADGYVQTAFFSLRPWTRHECARLTGEAEDQMEDQPVDSSAKHLLAALEQEFAPELGDSEPARPAWQIESIDQRVTVIAGRPLTDGFHFAETLTDDDARPFGRGENLYSGLSLRGTAGPFAGYLRAEFQRAAAAPAVNAFAEQRIAAADFTSSAAAGPISGEARGRILDGYVSFGIANNQFTFGRQSLWWGPGQSGATLFSNNAEPIDMLRYDRVRPLGLPGFLSIIGPIRAELLIGRLAGAQFVRPSGILYGTPGFALHDQPFLHGEKISFHPTPNLEFSGSRTTIFGGTGAPVTTASFLRSLFSPSIANGKNDPGDRRFAFDARYRIPGIRSCLTGYFDGFSDDQVFPLLYPTESAWIPGMTVRCVPHAPRLTFRAEGLLSPHRDLAFPGFFYFNVHYLSGYTNERQLIGSWIGREANGEQGWTTWNLSPRSSIEVIGRSMTVSKEFLSGGSLRDLRVAANLAIRPAWQVVVEEQTEWWRFPLLSAVPQHNAAFTLQISYRPPGRAQ